MQWLCQAVYEVQDHKAIEEEPCHTPPQSQSPQQQNLFKPVQNHHKYILDIVAIE